MQKPEKFINSDGEHTCPTNHKHSQPTPSALQFTVNLLKAITTQRTIKISTDLRIKKTRKKKENTDL